MSAATSKTEILRTLGLQERVLSGEPIHGQFNGQHLRTCADYSIVFDLPQLYQKPSLDMLHGVLTLLDLPPSTFDTPSTSDNLSVHPDGITAYLTKIISNPLSWLSSDDDREAIWDVASQRLSQRSGRTAMANMTRHFTIPITQTEDVTIKIYEPALTEDNLGLKTWSSSYVLAKKLHLLGSYVPLAQKMPVLELGAGTGLVGLAAAVVWQVPVVLTDLPAIIANLARNVEDNAEIVTTADAAAVAGTLDWLQPEFLIPYGSNDAIVTSSWKHSPAFALLSATYPQPKVNTILAADPIYSSDHPRMLVNVVAKWLSDCQHARLVLAYPIREAYLPQIADLKQRLRDIGLIILVEGTEMSRDDWAKEVEVRWSVWKRSG